MQINFENSIKPPLQRLVENKEKHSNGLTEINEEIEKLIANHTANTNIDLQNSLAVNKQRELIQKHYQELLKKLSDSQKVLRDLIILQGPLEIQDQLNRCLELVKKNPPKKNNEKAVSLLKKAVSLLKIDDSDKKAWLNVISNEWPENGDFTVAKFQELLITKNTDLNHEIDTFADTHKLWGAVNDKKGEFKSKQKKDVSTLEAEINSLKKEWEFFDELSGLLSEKEAIVTFNQRVDSIQSLDTEIQNIEIDAMASEDVIDNMEKQLEGPPETANIDLIFDDAKKMQSEVMRQLELADSLMKDCDNQQLPSTTFELESSDINQTLKNFQLSLAIQKKFLNVQLHRVLSAKAQCEIQILESQIIQFHNSKEQSALDNLLEKATELNEKLQGEYYSDEIKNRAADLLTIPDFLNAQQELQELKPKYQRMKHYLAINLKALGDMEKMFCTNEWDVELFKQIGRNLHNILERIDDSAKKTGEVNINLLKNQSEYWKLKLKEPREGAISLLNEFNSLSQANLDLLNKYLKFNGHRGDLAETYKNKLSLHLKDRASFFGFKLIDFFTHRRDYIKKLQEAISNYANTANSQSLLRVITEGSKRFDDKGMARILNGLISDVQKQNSNTSSWMSEAARKIPATRDDSAPQFRT
jgi:hypothetical protein